MNRGTIGTPVSRVDGRAKVTGEARYAAEHPIPGLLWGFAVPSPIAKGTITSIDTSAALSLPGVSAVFTHENVSGLAWFDRSYRDQVAPTGSPFRPLGNREILFSGQPVALVVAESYELARFAASQVHAEYESVEHLTDLGKARPNAYAAPKGKMGFEPPPKPLGDAERALAEAPYRVDAEYSLSVEHHNPMEMFATTAVWHDDDESLTIWDKTQGVSNIKEYVTSVFGMSPNKVRIRSPFMGGGFGSGLRPQYNLFLAVLATLKLQRSVRVMLTRQQMFTIGYRPDNRQRIALASDESGKLQAIIHETVQTTSSFEDYTENVVNWSTTLYHAENTRLDYKLAKLDLYSPIDMRAPGAASGVAAYESAIDELAFRTGIDPLEFRLRNYTERDYDNDKPFSSKELRECYRQAAERFGWSQRNGRPRSMRDGDLLVGWGMATGIWESQQSKSAAKAALESDGRLSVESGASDIGPGTYTIMTQIAADSLGLPIEQVTFQLGDTNMPEAVIEGGSMTAASVGSAVDKVCGVLREQIFEAARSMKNSVLGKARYDDVDFIESRIVLKDNPALGIDLSSVAAGTSEGRIEATATSVPNMLHQRQYTTNVHSAIFVEVKVDDELGVVSVTRVVSAVAGGRILNPKTARSQILGGVVWGIGMALEQESVIDQKFGRFINHDLAEYHVPVNADVPDIEILFVEEHDSVANPLGVKGLGEIGIVGVAGAIANAVFHATGKRIRSFPITLDKLL